MLNTRLRVWLVASTILAVCGATGCGTREPALKVHAMGETVEAGSFGFQVSGSDWASRIGEGPEARTPVHRYLVIRLSAFNRSVSDLAVPLMTLVGDDGQTYPEVGNVTADPGWLGLNRKVRPNESVQGNVVFDVPPAHYRLRVADESGLNNLALIDIPLRIQSDTDLGDAR